jgi:hypothetical protein
MQTLTDRKTVALTKKQTIIELLANAKNAWRNLKDLEAQFLRVRDFVMFRGWVIGGILVELKEQVGYGEWDKWLPLNFPELGAKEETRRINARRMMKLWRDNQSTKLLSLGSTDKSVGIPTDLSGKLFNTASERKFMWQYVPEKERPKGKDIRFPRSVSFINIVNEYSRLKHRHVNGLQLVDYDEAREETVELLAFLKFLHNETSYNPWAAD